MIVVIVVIVEIVRAVRLHPVLIVIAAHAQIVSAMPVAVLLTHPVNYATALENYSVIALAKLIAQPVVQAHFKCAMPV